MVLVLGAMIGLFGQGVAPACPPRPAHATAGMAMTDNCMTGAEAPAPARGNKPCKVMTLACIAAMGCTIPLVVPVDHVVLAPASKSAPIHDDGALPRLAGRDLAPEPDPPSVS